MLNQNKYRTCSNNTVLEHQILEIEFNRARLVVTTSPSTTNENKDTINNLISEICNQHVGNNLIIGDFNYHINWSIHDITTRARLGPSAHSAVNEAAETDTVVFQPRQFRKQQYIHSHTSCSARPNADTDIAIFWNTDSDYRTDFYKCRKIPKNRGRENFRGGEGRMSSSRSVIGHAWHARRQGGGHRGTVPLQTVVVPLSQFLQIMKNGIVGLLCAPGRCPLKESWYPHVLTTWRRAWCVTWLRSANSPCLRCDQAKRCIRVVIISSQPSWLLATC